MLRLFLSTVDFRANLDSEIYSAFYEHACTLLFAFFYTLLDNSQHS
jgi:hypothetical protein